MSARVVIRPRHSATTVALRPRRVVLLRPNRTILRIARNAFPVDSGSGGSGGYSYFPSGW